MEIAGMHDVIDRLHQVMCGLHGHDTMLQFEQDRMFLRCQSCGHETPGWDLNEAPPVISAAAAEERPRAVAAHLIGERRVA